MDKHQKEFLKKLEDITQEDIEKADAEYEKMRATTLICSVTIDVETGEYMYYPER